MNEQDDKLSISSSMSISSNVPGIDEQSTNSPSKSQSSSTYNLPNVIKHIYALKHGQKPISSNSSNNSNSSASLATTAQSDTSKQFWMPDDQVKECFECNDKFTTFRRRHVRIE